MSVRQCGARRRMVLALCGGIVAALTTGALAADQAGVSPLDLSLKFKVGDTSRYRLAVQVDARLPSMGVQPSASVYNINLDLVEQEKVIRLLPNGGGEIAISTLSGQGLSNGTPFTPLPDKRPAIIGFSARGDLLSARDLPSASAGVPMLSNMFGSGAVSMNGVFLPDKPVHVGDAWSKKVKIAGLTGNALASVKASLVKLEEVDHYKTARIHAVLTAPLHTMIDSTYQPTLVARAAIGTLTGIFNMTYDTNLAISEGKIVRASGDGDVTVTIQPLNGAAAPPAAGKPHSSGKTAGVKPAAAAPQGFATTKMVMRLHMGNNLIQ
jgi:hypothetical protein